MKKSAIKTVRSGTRASHAGLVNGIGELLEAARHATARVTNTFMTATYWEVAPRMILSTLSIKSQAVTQFVEAIVQQAAAQFRRLPCQCTWWHR